MKIQLRDYQLDLKARALASLANNHSVLAQLPTGGGKSHTMASIVADWVGDGKRVLVLAHRGELLTQLKHSFGQHFSESVGWLKAGKITNFDAPVQLGSIGSVASRAQRAGNFDYIIVDECHRSAGKTYRDIFEYWKSAKLLGFTATPCRLDGKPLGDIYDDLVQGISVGELIKLGALTPYDICLDPHPMRTGGRSMGEFKNADLEDLNDAHELSAALVEQYEKFAAGKTNLVFCVSVEHSRIIAQAYNAAGTPAAHLAGDCTKTEQSEVLAKFKNREIMVLTSVELYTEGLDIPGLECVQIARPTMSLAKYLQMLGRVLRPAPNKTRALILDHTSNHVIHGFADDEREWSLTGKPKNKRQEKDKEDEKKRKQEQEQRALELATELKLMDEIARDKIRAKKAARAAALKDLEMANAVIFRPSGNRLPGGNSLFEPQPQGTIEWWKWEIDRIITYQKNRDYKPSWATYQLVENYYPPHAAWVCAAEKLGYQRGWAWHKYQETTANRQMDGGKTPKQVELSLGEVRGFVETPLLINF
jgi:superfamily II DNA or RNA helicase